MRDRILRAVILFLVALPFALLALFVYGSVYVLIQAFIGWAPYAAKDLVVFVVRALGG